MIRNARLAIWFLLSLLIGVAGNVQLNYCQLKWQREVPAFTECPFGKAHFSVTWPAKGKARMMWNATHPDGTWMPPYFAVIDEADKDMRWYLRDAFIFYGYVPYGIMFCAFLSCFSSLCIRRRIGTRDLSFVGFASGVFVLNEIILKNRFMEARPMQSCCTTCGMPSGHSALAVGYWTCMLCDMSLRVYSGHSEIHGAKYARRGCWSFGKALLFILCPGCSFSPEVTHTDFVFIAITWSVLLLPVPFSRIGTHDHTPAQVMVGSCVGFISGILWMAFIRRMQHFLFEKSGAVILRFPPRLYWGSKEIPFTVKPTSNLGFSWEVYRAVIARVETNSEEGKNAYEKGVRVGSKLTKVGDYDPEKDSEKRKKEAKLERRLLDRFLLKHKEGKEFEVTFVKACCFCRWPLIEVTHDFLLPKQIAEESQVNVPEDHLKHIWRYYKSFSGKDGHCCPYPIDIRVEPVVGNGTCRGCIEIELLRAQFELPNFSGEDMKKVGQFALGIADVSRTVLPRVQFELSDWTGANTWIRYEVFSESIQTWENKEDLRLDIRDETSRTLRSKPMVFARKFRFQVYQGRGNEHVWPYVDLAEKTKTAISEYFQQGCKGNVKLGKDGDVLRFKVTHPTRSADDVKLVPHDEVDQKAESDKPSEAVNSPEEFESPQEMILEVPQVQTIQNTKPVPKITNEEGASTELELNDLGGPRRDLESASRGAAPSEQSSLATPLLLVKDGADKPAETVELIALEEGGRIQIPQDRWEVEKEDGNWKPFSAGVTLDVGIGGTTEYSIGSGLKYTVTFDTEQTGISKNIRSGKTRRLRKVVASDNI